MFRVAEEQLPALFAFLAKTKNVHVPIKKGEQSNYELWSENAVVDLDSLKTSMSPKNHFFSHSETLYTSTVSKNQISIEPETLKEQPFVVFGVKGCDVRGIDILDNVFLCSPIDKFYEARRKNAVIISMACNEPQLTCFCKTLNIDAANPESDIVTWKIGGFLYFEPRTEKGKLLCSEINEFLELVKEDSIVESRKESIRNKIEDLPYSNLSLEKFKPEALNELFNSPKWSELYQACLACGTCTFICPTCQCYDIKDFKTGNEVRKYRCWDSCMYSDFTLMAHGNPRKTQMERFRQRFMHKLVYYPANNGGVYSCVGCGRCINKCPVSLNIVKVIKSMEVSENV